MAEPLYTVGSLRMDNTVVSTNKSLSYSQDNKVAIATDQGIVIVYLNRLDQFIGRGSLFGETEILPTPDRTNTYDVGVTHSQLEASLGLNSEEFMRLVLDKTLTPKTDCSMTSYKLYKQVAWSPRHVSTYQSCMLATLTRDHRLCLWSPKKKVLGCHHSMIARMSDMLHDHEKSHDYPMANEMSEDTQNGDLMKFKHRTYSLAAVCMSWSGMVYSDTVDTDDCSYSYLLAVAMKSGHVVIWKVPDVSDFSSELCSTTVATSVYTHTLNPLTIQWCLLTEKCSIILTGHSNGLINAFPVFTTETGISVGPTVKVWSEQDHIAVVHLTWDRKTRLLIANKGVYLIKMNMNVIGGEVKVLSLDHHLSGAGSLGFTDIILCGRVLVCGSKDGTLKTLAVTESGFESPITVNNEPKKSRSFNMASSPNCHLVALSQQPLHFLPPVNSLARHRDGLQIKLLTYGIADSSALLESAELKLQDDLLLCMLSLLPDKLPSSLVHLVKEVDLTTMNACQQKVTWFLLQALLKYSCISLISLEPDTDPKLVERLTSVGSIIFKTYAISILEKLCKRISDGQQFLDKEIHSMRLFCQFLTKIEVSNESINRLVESVQQKISLNTNAQEVCIICDTDIPFTSPHSGNCSNGHSFPRCCKTLILVIDSDYKRCTRCGAFLHVLAMTSAVFGEVQCTFCDGY